MNEVCLLGRTTKDIELKTTQNGKSVTSFGLAVKRKYSKDAVDFLPIVAWGKTAEFASNYVSKGQMIAVKGSVQTRKYTNQNGEERTAIEIIAEDIYFTGDKGGNRQEEVPPAPYVSEDDDDELPF